MKNILLLIHDDDGQEARFQAALDVARALGGHVTCLDLTILPRFADDGCASSAGAMLLAEEVANETRHGTHMRARMEREDVPFDWISKTGWIEQSIEERTRLMDLVVLSTDRDGELFPHMTGAIGDLLVRTGKPVLAVPAGATHLDLFGKAMVAWDGSDDAEAAMAAAAPLLRLARTVVLYHVNDRSPEVPVEEAACYLSRHGIEPVIRSEPVGIDRVGAALLCEADMGHYDYAVMGAFGHSRTLETIFGGATRSMLKRGKVPMLLVHRR